MRLIQRGINALVNDGVEVFIYKAKRYFSRKGIYDRWIIANEFDVYYTDTLEYNPMFSVVIPVYNVADNMLRECIDSVLSQTYTNFEVILVDDCSTMESVRDVLKEYENRDKVTVIYRSENGHISKATNTGIKASQGEFIALCDCDDLYAPNALYEVAKKLNENRDYDFIYSDEDKISEDGKVRRDPFFKPDWSPETFMSYMYTCHLAVYRKSLVDKLDGIRVGFEGSQDYDFVLRLMELTDRIGHVPKILYHWRMRKESTANNLTAKPYIMEATKKAKLEALSRRGLKGHLEFMEDIGQFRVVYEPQNNPLVSIIIPSKDNPKVLFMCLDSIYANTSYKNFEIILVDNGSHEDNRKLIEAKTKELGVKYFYEPAPFNFSAMCNSGASKASGDILLFLNDDIEIKNKAWLDIMAGQAQVSYTGAVGCKLYYPGGIIFQHAGVLNLPIGPGHCLYGMPDNLNYYYGRNLLDYNYLAVTGACLMVETAKFNQVGGFDEQLPVAYNDVDLCFKLYEAGYHNVIRNDIAHIHHESVSRGVDAQSEAKEARRKNEMAKLYERHPALKGYDPCYNPNLVPDKGDFSFNLSGATKPSKLESVDNLPSSLVSQINADPTNYNQPKDVTYSIDNVLFDDAKISIRGWAIDATARNNNKNNIKIILKNTDGKIYTVSITKIYRPDILGPKGNGRSCKMAGFEALIPARQMPEGKHEIGIMINGKYIKTGYTIC